MLIFFQGRKQCRTDSPDFTFRLILFMQFYMNKALQKFWIQLYICVFCMISIILNNFHQIFRRCKGKRTQSVLPAKRFQVYPFVTFNSYQIVITFLSSRTNKCFVCPNNDISLSYPSAFISVNPILYMCDRPQSAIISNPLVSIP